MLAETMLADTGLLLSQSDFFRRLLVVTGIGFLLGLEREYNARKSGQEEFAGVRTFIFIAVLGFIGGLMYALGFAWLLGGAFLSVLLLVMISYYSTAGKGDVGGTTEVAAILTFFLGLTAYMGYVEESLVITVGVLVILSSKFRLHKAIGSITPGEMYDFIRFVVLAVLIFPFLPDENYGKSGVINPHEIGLVILLISGIGFVGYLLMKFLGSKTGILVTGILGGLVSSTAVTWVFSKKSRDNVSLSNECATAIMAANSVMVLRVLVLVFLFNRNLLLEMVLPLAIILAAAAGITYFFNRLADTDVPAQADLKKESPLQLKGSLFFGLVYTFILWMVSYSSERYGNEGILVSSAISGITDIDAITISVSRLAGATIDLSVAQSAILIAAISNTVVKMGIGIWAGSAPFRKRLITGYGLILVAAIVAILLVSLNSH